MLLLLELLQVISSGLTILFVFVKSIQALIMLVVSTLGSIDDIPPSKRLSKNGIISTSGYFQTEHQQHRWRRLYTNRHDCVNPSLNRIELPMKQDIVGYTVPNKPRLLSISQRSLGPEHDHFVLNSQFECHNPQKSTNKSNSFLFGHVYKVKNGMDQGLCSYLSPASV